MKIRKTEEYPDHKFWILEYDETSAWASTSIVFFENGEDLVIIAIDSEIDADELSKGECELGSIWDRTIIASQEATFSQFYGIIEV